MADKLMYIPSNGTQNYPYGKFELEVETFEYLTLLTNQSNLIKGPTVVKPTNKKTLLLKFQNLCDEQPIVTSLSADRQTNIQVLCFIIYLICT